MQHFLEWVVGPYLNGMGFEVWPKLCCLHHDCEGELFQRWVIQLMLFQHLISAVDGTLLTLFFSYQDRAYCFMCHSQVQE